MSGTLLWVLNPLPRFIPAFEAGDLFSILKEKVQTNLIQSLTEQRTSGNPWNQDRFSESPGLPCGRITFIGKKGSDAQKTEVRYRKSWIYSSMVFASFKQGLNSVLMVIAQKPGCHQN